MKNISRKNIPVLLVFLISNIFTVPSVTGCTLSESYYTLTVTIEGGGTVTIDPEDSEYIENSTVTLTAAADDGYEFVSWSGVDAEEDNTAFVLMDTDITVTATFSSGTKSDNPTDNIISEPSVGFAPSEDEGWTFMIYLDGDNSLDSYSEIDFNEIEEGFLAGSNTNMNIIILYDRSSAWDDEDTADSDDDDSIDSGTRLYEIIGDSDDAIASTRLYPAEDDGYSFIALSEGEETELNMGNPDVLSDFMIYCAAEYPAEHYALVLWNHGNGARSINTETTGTVTSRLICEDDDTGTDGDGDSDYLYMNEVQEALAAVVDGGYITEGLDLIGADACLMATVEAAYELRNYTEVYAASMNSEGAAGWDYEDLFGRMTAGQNGTDAEALGKLIVDSFYDTAGTSITPTMSAVRSSELEELKSNIDIFAAELYNAEEQSFIENIRDEAVDFFDDESSSEAISYPYHDLNDLCYFVINNAESVSEDAGTAAETVIESLADAVISAYAGEGLGNYYGSGTDVKRGLSIFFSKGNKTYNGYSHYAYQYWYTDQDLDNYSDESLPDGELDFCTSDEDSIVETWRELHEAWYDPLNNYTPGSW